MKELDRLLRVLIEQRDGACVLCGYGGNLDVAHLFKRRYKALRYHPLNNHMLCRRCHSHEHSYKGRNMYKDWFIHKYGQDEYEKLLKLKGEDVKITEEWKENQKGLLLQQIENLSES